MCGGVGKEIIFEEFKDKRDLNEIRDQNNHLFVNINNI